MVNDNEDDDDVVDCFRNGEHGGSADDKECYQTVRR